VNRTRFDLPAPATPGTPARNTRGQAIRAALSLALLAAFWIGLPGCRRVNTVESMPEDPPPPAVVRRVTTNPNLDNGARVVRGYERRQGNLLRVNVELANLTSVKRPIKYRFTWFDEDRLDIYDPSAIWRREILEPGERFSISATAPDPRVTDWRLSVQPWDR
jgi:hypothetical protein